MKRLFSAVLASAVVALALPAQSSAQSAIIALGGGVTFPFSGYSDFANTGWLGHAGVNIPVGDAGLVVGAHGYYGSNNHETDGDKTNLYGAVGSVGFNIPTSGSVMPSVFAILGSMTHSFKSDNTPQFEGSSTTLAAGAGAGIGFPLGSITGGIQAWVLTGFGDNDETRIFGTDVFVGIPVGGNGM